MIRYISTAASLTVLLSMSFVDGVYAGSSKTTEPKTATTEAAKPAEAATAPAAVTQTGTGPVMAKVGDREIRKSEVDQKIAELKKSSEKVENKDNPIFKDLLDPKKKAELEGKVLESIITKMLLDDGVKKIKETEKFKKTAEAVLEEIAQKSFLIEQADKKITDEEIKSQYDAFVKARPAEDQAYIAIIRTSDEAKAKEAFEKLGKGEDFAKVAKEYSNDERTKNDGGAINIAIKKSDQSPKELVDAIFATSVGKVCDKPIRIEADLGKEGKKVEYLIFKVTKREPVPTPTLDQLKEPLKAAIRESKLPAVMADLRKNSKVEIFKYDASGVKPEMPKAQPSKDAKAG